MMTREDVIRLANEHGLETSDARRRPVFQFGLAGLEDFAALIERNAVEREREECALVVDASRELFLKAARQAVIDKDRDDVTEARSKAWLLATVADAIRARSNT